MIFQNNFQFQQSKDWKPFFTSKYPNPGLSTNQPDSLVYVVPEQSYVSQLADKIERILKVLLNLKISC